VGGVGSEADRSKQVFGDYYWEIGRGKQDDDGMADYPRQPTLTQPATPPTLPPRHTGLLGRALGAPARFWALIFRRLKR